MKGSHSNKSRTTLLFAFLVILLIIFFCLDILLGSVTIRLPEVFSALFKDTDSYIRTIIVDFRLPKAVTSLCAGIALSVSGLQMQTLFRNPMAGPYVLGVSSGASLGVAIVILGFSSRFVPGNLHSMGNWALLISAWAGAGAVMMLMMFIASRIRDIMTILIIGIMLASGISAVVGIMQYFSSETMLKAYVIWTMGSLGNLSSEQLRVLAVTVSAGVILSLASVKILNALLLGETYASSMGLDIKRSRFVIFAGTSILAGSVTAFCGPIGFIGIAVPHIARYLFKSADHTLLVPATIITGGIIMLASDIISQLPGSVNVLPVNSVTSLIGIPVVIWIILSNRKENLAI